jgi:hypothetical protein
MDFECVRRVLGLSNNKKEEEENIEIANQI